MSRIRYLKPDFFKDEDLAKLPFEIRLLFAGLWNFADKEGRLEDRPSRLKAEIFPYDPVDVEKGLKLLTREKQSSHKPFIVRYEIEGQRFIQILNWEKHQKPHHTEKESVIPPLGNGYVPLEKGMEKGMEKGKVMEKEVESILLHWNSLAEQHGLSKILKISDKRKANALTRLKESEFDLQKISKEIGSSDFLRGKNDRGWKADFDFVFGSTNNYLKILEGKYRNAGNHLTDDERKMIS